MSTDNKTRILSFLFGLAIGFTFIGTHNGCYTSQNNQETYTNNVVVAVNVKDELDDSTNQVNRAT